MSILSSSMHMYENYITNLNFHINLKIYLVLLHCKNFFSSPRFILWNNRSSLPRLKSCWGIFNGEYLTLQGCQNFLIDVVFCLKVENRTWWKLVSFQPCFMFLSLRISNCLEFLVSIVLCWICLAAAAANGILIWANSHEYH